MILTIPNVLSRDECRAIRGVLADDDIWKDGGATAVGAAKAAKQNLQADPEHALTRGTIEKIRNAVEKNQIFLSAARPADYARVLLSSYGPGMSYGAHVDAAYIEGMRADLAFTLFLSPPTEYEGGELIVDNAGHEDRVKLPAGSMALLPATTIHRVSPVVSGRRLACVGWVKSRIRDAQTRALLFDFDRALSDLPAGDARLRLVNIRNTLLRLFGD
ncbi:MAG: Fe2+-dependent dioxygenase [Pseudomonadota bacterium]